jgi:hypothetical protein
MVVLLRVLIFEKIRVPLKFVYYQIAIKTNKSEM